MIQMERIVVRQDQTAMIIQARMGSSRLPGKVCAPIAGRPMLHHQVERLRAHGLMDRYRLIIATTTNPEDDQLEALGNEIGALVYRGDALDIALRFLGAARLHEVETIIRLQGDDPLVDPAGICRAMEVHREGAWEVTTGAHRGGWVMGTSVVVMQSAALQAAHDHYAAVDPARLTAGFVPMEAERFNTAKITPGPGEARDDIFLTVDYPEDFDVVSRVIEHFIETKGYLFDNRDIIGFCDQQGICQANRHLHEPFDD